MSDWNDARLLDQLGCEARLSDFPRSLDRARIADQANGVPPYTKAEAKENNNPINVNFLEMTVKTHESRAQFYQGIMKPGKYFTATTDFGPKYDRTENSTIVTKEVNRVMRKSVRYFEATRSKFAQIVLHGIAPGVWENSDLWCPRSIGIEDAFLPEGTLIGFDNLPRVILHRTLTGMELQRLAKGALVDPGWNMPMVNRLLKWLDEQASQLGHNYYPEVWSPEKQSERMKEGGYYASDSLPKVDAFDFYFYVDDGKKSGWIRRMILDSWGDPSVAGAGYTMAKRSDLGGNEKLSRGDFLYTSRNRRIYSSLAEFTTFQFGDLSAVAPFRYHSVRSLGYLLYATCHLQNRMRCKFNEAVFEALMMYFKVKTMDEAQRALKLDLVNRGFIDDTLTPVPAAERWQVNAQLVELGLRENAGIIEGHSSSFAPKNDFSRDSTEKTKFQVMAELNISTNLVSAALQQAYQYQNFEYREILRRFFKKNSTDSEVRQAQANIIRRGVPPSLLNADLWETEPERIMGAGNKTMELAIAEQMMQWRTLYDPSAQRTILRDATLAITDDADRAERLVPDEPVISDSIHDAQLASGALMQGLPVSPKAGMNHQDYIGVLLVNMDGLIQRIQQTGGVGRAEQLLGLYNMNTHVEEHLKMMEQDEEQKALVKTFRDKLGKLMNMVKAFTQRLKEQMEKQAQEGGGAKMDPKDMAKIMATQTVADQKAENLKSSHATKTAQRQVQFEMTTQQQQQKAALDLQIEQQKAALEISKETQKTALEFVRSQKQAEKPEKTKE